jgi:hypothetical protein
LGTFIAVNSSFKSSTSCVVVHLLVELDLSKGLYESIMLVAGECSCVQVLDYLNVPFQCVIFHSFGHVVEDYEIKFLKRNQIFSRDHSNSHEPSSTRDLQKGDESTALSLHQEKIKSLDHV